MNGKQMAFLAGSSLFTLFMAGKRRFDSVDKKTGSVVSQHYFAILKASIATGVPPELIGAVAWQENRGRSEPGALGEIGVMQIMPIAYADLKQKGYNVPDHIPAEPGKNILMGAQFLQLMRKGFDNWRDALRSYNAAGTNYAKIRNNPGLAAGYADSVLEIAREYGYTGN